MTDAARQRPLAIAALMLAIVALMGERAYSDAQSARAFAEQERRIARSVSTETCPARQPGDTEIVTLIARAPGGGNPEVLACARMGEKQYVPRAKRGPVRSGHAGSWIAKRVASTSNGGSR